MTIPQTESRQLCFFFLSTRQLSLECWRKVRDDRNITLNNYRGHPLNKRQQAAENGDKARELKDIPLNLYR